MAFEENGGRNGQPQETSGGKAEVHQLSGVGRLEQTCAAYIWGYSALPVPYVRPISFEYITRHCTRDPSVHRKSCRILHLSEEYSLDTNRVLFTTRNKTSAPSEFLYMVERAMICVHNTG